MTKIIITIMIKNEEKIIKRCLSNVLSIADAICISDTGSTDNTINILNDYLPTLSIKTKIVNHTWKNFGNNRTLSFKESQIMCTELGWDLENTYAFLIDADMNVIIKPEFNKNNITENGYLIKQQSINLEYYNIRIIKLNYPWTCIGVTHEYWNGTSCKNLDSIYINDIGDGGCKNDKFKRDELLLKKGLEEEPTNVRYMFYLAQTLKDLKKYNEAIELYKMRINSGGWYEEIWYSMYMISKIYYLIDNIIEMEYWGLKAYEINNNRAENIYFLTKIFREKMQHYKSWHYMTIGNTIKKPNKALFLEKDVYTKLFKYEKTILNYYIQPHKYKENLTDIIEYINNYGGHGTTFTNLQFYVQPIKKNNVTNNDYIAPTINIKKKWIHLDNELIIYSWYPYKIGKMNNNEFIETMMQEVPNYFYHISGSSNVVEYNNLLWTLTHVNINDKYYHQLICLNKNSKKIISYSYPFYFIMNQTEYCLGIEIKNDILYSVVSKDNVSTNNLSTVLIESLLLDIELYKIE
jgi:tetratricopeptide (TPR) repeat protein